MIEIDPNFIVVIGRVLDPPDVVFGDHINETLNSERSDFRNRQLVKPCDKVVNWALVCVGQEKEYKGVKF